MPPPADPKELELVRLAISLAHVTGCFEWEPKAYRLVRADPPLPGLTPKAVRDLVTEYVNNGGEVLQVPEVRAPWSGEREFWYKVIVPHKQLPRGLFVELVLHDADPDCPVVLLVNAHPQN